MSKKVLHSVSKESVKRIAAVNDKIVKKNLEFQRKQIFESSPFSRDVNRAFSGYEEFSYLLSLGLQEALVTRKSLIKNIDFDLYVTEKQRTNYELMRQGSAPYVKDDKDSYIILHHIGQGFDAPFAELTAEEHARFGNSKLLHGKSAESWRQDPSKEQAFMAERSTYWKKRARKEITLLLETPATQTPNPTSDAPNNLALDARTVLETLFSECSVEDLTYISNLAQSYLLVKEIGVKTVEEFIAATKAVRGIVTECPACGGTDISLYGSYQTEKEKKQRYKCKKCNKVFSSLYNTLIQGCAFSLFEWVRFVDCIYNGYSIEKTALLCGISKKTAFDNRIRLFFALDLLEANVLLEGNVVIDETYTPTSYKGNHKQQKNFCMPRTARKRGSENHEQGLSENLVCVVCAMDEYGTSVAKIAGFGAPSAKQLEAALEDHMKAENIKQLYSDESPAIRSFANKHNFPITQSKLRTPKQKGSKSYETIRQLQRVNAYHARLKKFLGNFNGISSELLQGYVSLFSWKERNRELGAIEAYKELLGMMVTPIPYINAEQSIDDLLEKIYADSINIKLHFINAQSEDKTKKIYALYAQGMPTKEIATQFECTPQAITRRIRNYRAWGLAYKTKKEAEAEKAAKQKGAASDKAILRYIARGEYLDKLLDEKQSWEGSLESFYLSAEQRYNRSRQTIKNDIATAKRVADLRASFYAGEEYEYMDSRRVFEKIFYRYNEIIQQNPQLQKRAVYQQLAEEFEYTHAMIYNIVSAMKHGNIDWDKKSKNRIPTTQTLNRDRSVFIDYLNWIGTKQDFLQAAAKKYYISVSEVQHIIRINYIADPHRYEIAEID